VSQVLIVSPVGTSVLSNFVRESRFKSVIERYSSKNVESWHRLSPSDPLNTVPGGYICGIVRGSDLYNAMLDYVRSEPARASSELNAILRLLESVDVSREVVEVFLYNTQTCNSRLCRSLLEDYLRGEGVRVQSIEIRGLGSLHEFDSGLVEVLDKVVRVVVDRKRQGTRVYVNATPGFKPESTFFVIASILAGADSIFYIHEGFRELVRLPMPPLSLRRDEVEELVRLLGTEGGAPLYAVRQELGDEGVRRLVEMGLVEKREGMLVLRRWVRKLLEVFESGTGLGCAYSARGTTLQGLTAPFNTSTPIT